MAATPATPRPPAPIAPIAETASRLHSVAIHLLRRLRREDAASGLTAPRLSALSVVVFGGPLGLGALADAEGVRPPTMTRIVAALEGAGLVRREANPADGRAILIAATAAGRRLLEEGRGRRTSRLARQLATLGADELATIERAVAILERLEGEGEERAGQATREVASTVPPPRTRSRSAGA